MVAALVLSACGTSDDDGTATGPTSTSAPVTSSTTPDAGAEEPTPTTTATAAAGAVLLAAGAYAGELSRAVPVRPVKGEALLLRDPAGPGLCDHVLRYEGGYLVPRGDGRYYLGATVEEQGFDTSVTALGVYELLREAAEVLPGILELQIDEHFAGLRPGTPDNAPIIGTDVEHERVVWATGHYRNGILLCPVTADLVAGVLVGDSEPPAAFSPARFATATAKVQA
jgi:glycine oxidase